MQYFYDEENQKKSDNLKSMVILLGHFLLEIKKSMGNEATKLENWDMCEWWMADSRKLKSGEIS